MTIWSGKDIAKRRKLLTSWLTQQPGEAPCKLAYRSYAEIAAALVKEFRRPIGARTAERMVRDAQAAAPDKHKPFLLRKRGRPRADGTQKPSAPAPPPSKRRQTSIGRRAMKAAMLYELCVLTGMTAASLYELLEPTFGGDDWFWGRSAFLAHLAALRSRIKAARPQTAWRPEYSGDEPSHTLRIHQVNVRGHDGAWLSILLAYDLDTQYVNVAVYEIHGDDRLAGGAGLVQLPVRRGPRKKVPAPSDLAVFPPQGGKTPVQLSSRLVLAFAEDTQSKMALPVGTLMICDSLGDVEGLCAELRVSQPLGDFFPEANDYPAAALADALVQQHQEFDWKELAALINRHNGLVAQPELEARRQMLEDRERRGRASRGIRGVRPGPGSRLPKSPSGQEKEISKAIRKFWKENPLRPHRGRYITIKPIRITCKKAASILPAHSTGD